MGIELGPDPIEDADFMADVRTLEFYRHVYDTITFREGCPPTGQPVQE